MIGVLDIESRQPDYFTPDQQTILTLVASRIGTAVENARLYEHARNQAETLLLLNEIGREANSTLHVEEVLRRAAELTKRLIDYQIFSILLYDEAEHVFRHRVTVKFGQRIQEKNAVPAHEGIVGAAATLRRAVVVPDVSLDPRYLMVNPETRSELAVPMMYQGSRYRRDGPRKPAAELFHAGPRAGAFDSWPPISRSRSKTRASTSNWRATKRAWSAISTPRAGFKARCCRVLPGPEFGLDIAARVVSSRELSGDLYDFLRYGPQELGIALGDVSGKGKRGGALWRRGGRHLAQSRAAETAARGNASRHQWISGRAHDRRPLYDPVLRHLASRAAQAARRQCRAGTAAALPRRTMRKNSPGGIPAGNFRGSDLRPTIYHPRSRRRGGVLLGWNRRHAKSRRRILRPRSRRQDSCRPP